MCESSYIIIVKVTDPTNRSKRHKVLIVDVHPAMRHALRQVFGDAGDFEVIAEACTANDALSVARSVEPELAVVDLRLPDSVGIDLFRRLRDVRPGLRILVFSSIDGRLQAARFRNAGAHGFVSKTRDPGELLAASRLVIRGYTCFASELAAPVGVTLSRRETAVLHQLIRGVSNVDIAKSLGLSPKTISTYKRRMLQKLELRTLVDLLEYAKASGIG